MALFRFLAYLLLLALTYRDASVVLSGDAERAAGGGGRGGGFGALPSLPTFLARGKAGKQEDRP